MYLSGVFFVLTRQKRFGYPSRFFVCIVPSSGFNAPFGGGAWFMPEGLFVKWKWDAEDSVPPIFGADMSMGVKTGCLFIFTSLKSLVSVLPERSDSRLTDSISESSVTSVMSGQPRPLSHFETALSLPPAYQLVVSGSYSDRCAGFL